MAWDRISYNALYAGEEVKELGVRNTYTPGTFVTMGFSLEISTPTAASSSAALARYSWQLDAL